ncbi:hypothetical protein JHK86_010433 [Glycine max]|nr:hypothetical protein JHK86_010433 [Glycine max]
MESELRYKLLAANNRGAFQPNLWVLFKEAMDPNLVALQDYRQVKDLPDQLRLAYANLVLAIANGDPLRATESYIVGPRQRAEALATLNNAFNSSPETTSSADKLNGLNRGGPRQRAEALAALNSAFNSSFGTKFYTPRPSGRGQGSQKAAAVAALSSVLTAKKKKTSPKTSPVASTSPVVESSNFDTKSESAPSKMEVVEEVADVKETEEVAPETGTNGDSEQPKQENVEDGRNDSENNNLNVFSYEQLKTKSGSVCLELILN